MFNISKRKKSNRGQDQGPRRNNDNDNPRNVDLSGFNEISEDQWFTIPKGTKIAYKLKDGRMLPGGFVQNQYYSKSGKKSLYLHNSMDTSYDKYYKWPVNLSKVSNVWKHNGTAAPPMLTSAPQMFAAPIPQQQAPTSQMFAAPIQQAPAPAPGPSAAHLESVYARMADVSRDMMNLELRVDGMEKDLKKILEFITRKFPVP